MPRKYSKLATEAEVKQWVYKRHRKLSLRERRIFKLHYGLGEIREYTYAEIAKLIGVSPGRVREIELAAICRMREPETRVKRPRGRPPETLYFVEIDGVWQFASKPRLLKAKK